MARKPLAIADFAQVAVEVDLWGTIFNALPITRSKQTSIEDLQRQITEIDESNVERGNDRLVELLAEMIDVHVKPAGGRKKPASDFILEKWKGEELSTAQLFEFQQRLADAVRPT